MIVGCFKNIKKEGIKMNNLVFDLFIISFISLTILMVISIIIMEKLNNKKYHLCYHVSEKDFRYFNSEKLRNGHYGYAHCFYLNKKDAEEQAKLLSNPIIYTCKIYVAKNRYDIQALEAWYKIESNKLNASDSKEQFMWETTKKLGISSFIDENVLICLDADAINIIDKQKI